MSVSMRQSLWQTIRTLVAGCSPMLLITFSESADLGKYSELLAGVSLMRSLRYLLIGCGCFTILIAMCGCVGVCKEKRCLLRSGEPLLLRVTFCWIIQSASGYVILLFLVLLINLAAAIMAVVYKGDFKGMVGEQFQDRLKRHYGNLTIKESKMFTEAIDKLQRNPQPWVIVSRQSSKPRPKFHSCTPAARPASPAFTVLSCCGSVRVLDQIRLRKKNGVRRPKTSRSPRGRLHPRTCERLDCGSDLLICSKLVRLPASLVFFVCFFAHQDCLGTQLGPLMNGVYMRAASDHRILPSCEGFGLSR
uniref:Ion_trans domain-containing protein n=1 Tax=Macrostomum lignano TaxID=282301 RepID=A0A1I8FPC2_9PLAT